MAAYLLIYGISGLDLSTKVIITKTCRLTEKQENSNLLIDTLWQVFNQLAY